MAKKRQTQPASAAPVAAAPTLTSQQDARRALAAHRRAEAAVMHASGLSERDIAVRLGISETSVRHMIAALAQPASAAPVAAAPAAPSVGPSAFGPATAPIKRKRTIAVNRPTHPRMIRAKDRRDRCLEMRINGLSEREIAARLGVSKTQVIRMLRTSLDALNASELNGAAHLRRLELERCDKMVKGLMPHFRDPRYVDSILRIQERRANYLGIDAPKKEEILQRTTVEEDFPDLDALPDEDLDTIERLLNKARALNAAKAQGEHDAKT